MSGEVASLSKRTWRITVAAIAAVGASAGCGNVLYTVEVNRAAAKLEQARILGAEQLAPYEYTLARQHLAKAQSEAAEADYQDAQLLASRCSEYAEKAVRLAANAHRGAGR